MVHPNPTSPLWLIALISLLSLVWLWDGDAQSEVMQLSGHAQPWPTEQARAMTGVWYVVSSEPAQVDPHCAHPASVNVLLRAAHQLDYTLSCADADGQPYQAHGSVMQQTPSAEASWDHWWRLLQKLHLPNARQLLLVRAVDHPLGYASVQAPRATQPLLLSRSQRNEPEALQAYELQHTPLGGRIARNEAVVPGL